MVATVHPTSLLPHNPVGRPDYKGKPSEVKDRPAKTDKGAPSETQQPSSTPASASKVVVEAEVLGALVQLGASPNAEEISGLLKGYVSQLAEPAQEAFLPLVRDGLKAFDALFALSSSAMGLTSSLIESNFSIRAFSWAFEMNAHESARKQLSSLAQDASQDALKLSANVLKTVELSEKFLNQAQSYISGMKSVMPPVPAHPVPLISSLSVRDKEDKFSKEGQSKDAIEALSRVERVSSKEQESGGRDGGGGSGGSFQGQNGREQSEERGREKKEKKDEAPGSVSHRPAPHSRAALTASSNGVGLAGGTAFSGGCSTDPFGQIISSISASVDLLRELLNQKSIEYDQCDVGVFNVLTTLLTKMRMFFPSLLTAADISSAIHAINLLLQSNQANYDLTTSMYTAHDGSSKSLWSLLVATGVVSATDSSSGTVVPHANLQTLVTTQLPLAQVPQLINMTTAAWTITGADGQPINAWTWLVQNGFVRSTDSTSGTKVDLNSLIQGLDKAAVVREQIDTKKLFDLQQLTQAISQRTQWVSQMLKMSYDIAMGVTRNYSA